MRRRAVLITVSIYAAWTAFQLGMCVRFGGETCIVSSWWLLLSGLPISIPFAAVFGRCRPVDLTVLGIVGAAQWAAVVWGISGLVALARQRHRS